MSPPGDSKLRQNREVREITSALKRLLREDDPAIQMMNQDPVARDKLARSLARLVWINPQNLDELTKEQLFLEPCSSGFGSVNQIER